VSAVWPPAAGWRQIDRRPSTLACETADDKHLLRTAHQDRYWWVEGAGLGGCAAAARPAARRVERRPEYMYRLDLGESVVRVKEMFIGFMDERDVPHRLS